MIICQMLSKSSMLIKSALMSTVFSKTMTASCFDRDLNLILLSHLSVVVMLLFGVYGSVNINVMLSQSVT